MRRRTLLAGLAGTVTALGVTPPPSTAAQTSDPLCALERALLAPPAPGVPVDLRQLGHQIAAAQSLFGRGHYTELATGLPRLLSNATATRTSGRGGATRPG